MTITVVTRVVAGMCNHLPLPTPCPFASASSSTGHDSLPTCFLKDLGHRESYVSGVVAFH